MFSTILIPGLAGDATMWRAQLEALRDFRPRVTDVHMRCTTIESMAATLLEEHPGRLALCGASMGGMVALEAVRQAPRRVAGVALLGTNAQPENDDMRALREAAIELFAQGRVKEVIESNVAFAFHPDNAGDATLVQSYVDFVLRAGAEQLIRQNRAVIARPDARVHLSGLRCPVLVMCGDSDQLTPPECSQEIAALVRHAQLVMVPRCGHMLTMERPEIVNATLSGWMAQLDPDRAAPGGAIS